MPFVVNHFYGYYQESLNFNDDIIEKIIEEIYCLENHPDKKFHGVGRTFKLKDGFHSINILDKNLGVMEEYPHLRILVSRIQEILFNNYNSKDGYFYLTGPFRGNIRINELWINILRKGDYNIMHTHPNSDVSGNFYLQVPKEEYNSDASYKPGHLAWDSPLNTMRTVPNYMCKTSGNSQPTLEPKPNSGVIFHSFLPHQVLPHYSNTDRIGVAFNATFEESYTYDDIYPEPYWLPLKYELEITEDNTNGDIITHTFKNGLQVDIKHNKELLKNNIGKTIILCDFALLKYINKYTIDKDKYFFDPSIPRDDYFVSRNIKWGENDPSYYENNDADILMIIFSGKGGNGKKPTFIFNNFLEDYRFDKLFLRDFKYSWFLNNNTFNPEGTGDCVENLLYFIKSHIKERHNKIFVIGCSAGGYAAILYSHLLKANGCLAFAPQTVINDTKELILEDNRWKIHSDKLKGVVDEKYLDLNNFSPFNTRLKVFYTSVLDMKHAKHLFVEDNVEIEKAECKENPNNHLTAMIMRDNGKLKEELDRMIMGSAFTIF